MLYLCNSNPIKGRLLEDVGQEDFHYSKPGYLAPLKSRDFQTRVFPLLRCPELQSVALLSPGNHRAS